ncbi:hypothetical protein [Cellulomonas fengjieae]|uniref:Uncharacterized protein n=1 Tax=Cellulomonas fengjieae TaxID=2819978 RepID=A0ABS3SL52_9CELL|nr:hypothetical protein [Cellulomonas fengjieae]MBO3086457.1 hypothetical protein [Cellulomonas fengjieae]MBO3100452.1 hypothetical protein [Cellulomonas fengjieae]QVI66679.1 hypothetical protein KG102_03510 [Cellulomonas fengjieae]
MQPLTAGVLGKAALALVLGVVVGALGTVMHRSMPPWGMVVCLALAFAAALTTRAWAGWFTLVGYTGGLVLSMQVLATRGPGGDILVPDGQAIGWAWVLGAVAVTALVGVLPRRLFQERPRQPWEADPTAGRHDGPGVGA